MRLSDFILRSTIILVVASAFCMGRVCGRCCSGGGCSSTNSHRSCRWSSKHISNSLHQTVEGGFVVVVVVTIMSMCVGSMGVGGMGRDIVVAVLTQIYHR